MSTVSIGVAWSMVTTSSSLIVPSYDGIMLGASHSGSLCWRSQRVASVISASLRWETRRSPYRLRSQREGGRRNAGKLKMLSLDSSQTSRQFVTIWFCERDRVFRHVVPFVSKGDVRLTVFSVSTAHARNRDAREPGLGVRPTRCLHEECNATQAPSRESHG